jgi:hypothetical protein
MKTVKCVTATDRIFFDENVKTFRLYAGNSLYAISISPELTLEHLYWGKTLHPGYDLRYLNQSSRPTHFSTLEAAPDYLEASLVPSDTLEDIQRAWRDSKNTKNVVDSMDAFHKRRLENYTWRIMSKKSQEEMRSHDNPLSLEDLGLEPTGEDSAVSTPRGEAFPLTRKRSTSVPSSVTAPPATLSTISADTLKRTPWDERSNPNAIEFTNPHTQFAKSSLSLASLAAASSNVNLPSLGSPAGKTKTPQMSPLHRTPSAKFGVLQHHHGMSHAFERDEGIIGEATSSYSLLLTVFTS